MRERDGSAHSLALDLEDYGARGGAGAARQIEVL